MFYAGVEGYVYDAFGSQEGVSFTDKLYVKPLIGLKYYFTERAAFDINIGYGFGFSEGSGGMIQGGFGISIIL